MDCAFQMIPFLSLPKVLSDHTIKVWRSNNREYASFVSFQHRDSEGLIHVTTTPPNRRMLNEIVSWLKWRAFGEMILNLTQTARSEISYCYISSVNEFDLSHVAA